MVIRFYKSLQAISHYPRVMKHDWLEHPRFRNGGFNVIFHNESSWEESSLAGFSSARLTFWVTRLGRQIKMFSQWTTHMSRKGDDYGDDYGDDWCRRAWTPNMWCLWTMRCNVSLRNSPRGWTRWNRPWRIAMWLGRVRFPSGFHL